MNTLFFSDLLVAAIASHDSFLLNEFKKAFDKLDATEKVAFRYFFNVFSYLNSTKYEEEYLRKIEDKAEVSEQYADGFRRNVAVVLDKLNYITWDFIPQLAPSFEFQADLEENFEDFVKQI